MLLVLHMVLFLLVATFRLLFTAVQPPPSHASRTSNLSQALIDDLLHIWVARAMNETSNTSTSVAYNSTELPEGGITVTAEPLSGFAQNTGLFTAPPEPVMPEWSVILGTYDHYDDENWENFLIQSEVPLFIRRLLGWSSEVLDIKKTVVKDTKTGDSDFQLLITTANWLITHQSRFFLRHTYVENDLDGTDSENTFYFLTPRTLVQDKLKEQWHMFLFRQFDEDGCNMTVVDRGRGIAARRFYKRTKKLTS